MEIPADLGGEPGHPALVLRASLGLRRRGLLPGDPVAVVLPPGPRFALASDAVAAAGGHVVAAQPHPGLAADLASIRPRIMITDLAEADELAEDAGIRQVYSFDPVPGATPFEDLLGFSR